MELIGEVLYALAEALCGYTGWFLLPILSFGKLDFSSKPPRSGVLRINDEFAPLVGLLIYFIGIGGFVAVRLLAK